MAAQGRRCLVVGASKGPGKRHATSPRVGARAAGFPFHYLLSMCSWQRLPWGCCKQSLLQHSSWHTSSYSILLLDKLHVIPLQDCGRVVDSPEEVALAAGFLHPAIAGVWAPAAAWQLEGVRAGVRAMSRRTNEGTPPLAGRLESPPGSRRATARSPPPCDGSTPLLHASAKSPMLAPHCIDAVPVINSGLVWQHSL